MREKLDNLLIGVTILTLPLITTVLLSVLVYLVTGLSIGISVLITIGIETVLGYLFYLYVKKEISQFKVDLGIDDEDGII